MKNFQILIILLLSVILINCSKNEKVDNMKEEKPSSAAIDQQQKESEKINSMLHRLKSMEMSCLSWMKWLYMFTL